MSAIIAIVGRPNVGKSALFNRIVGKRIAIVHDEPGVTRDRISAEAEWRGRPFTLVDTGGIGLLQGEKTQDIIVQAAYTQVQIAIDAAQVIIMVVNVEEGLVPLDLEVAKRLRRSGKPIVVAINKTDHPGRSSVVNEFCELGFELIFPVSAIHGLGMAELMKAAVGLLPRQRQEAPGEMDALSGPVSDLTIPQNQGRAESREIDTQPQREGQKNLPDTVLKIAIVGRPNVGKSSLTNALTQSERVIVSPIPGTTRDSVDVPFEVETAGVRQKYILIDTAGLRKKRRLESSIEFFSVKRAEDSIRRCDIALLVLDAEQGILEQDKKVADLIVEAHKACIIVVNKWDMVQEQVAKNRAKEKAAVKRSTRHGPQAKTLATLGEFGQWVQERLFFLDYAPVIFTSATEGFHLDRLLEAVRFVAAQLRQKVPTALLNRLLQGAIEERQPVSATGHRLKFFYATQVQTAPPTFWLFVNRNELFSPPYTKYLADRIRRAFGYEGCPVLLVAKPRPKTIESKRTHRR